MIETLFYFIKNNTPLFYLIQPIWRDEAFCVLAAQKNLLEIFYISSLDFTPPLFLFLLHFWVKLFGNNELIIRLLPFSFHIGTVLISYQIGKYLAYKNKLSTTHFPLVVSVLVAFNPMLLYYAFEIRTYSLLVFIAAFSLYAYFLDKRKLYLIVGTLGLYTHYYFIFIPTILFLYNLINPQIPESFLALKKKFLKNYYLVIPFILFLPWIPFFFKQIINSSETWRYPVDFKLWLASLGNLFTGYYGNPPKLWHPMKFLSLMILIASFFVLKRKSKAGLIIFLLMIIPVILTLTASFFQPLWVNRYLIYVALAENFMIALFIYNLQSPAFKKIVLITTIIFILGFNIWFTPFNTKTDYRTPINKLKNRLSSNDLILVTDPIHFFETRFYLLNTKNEIKLYNPANINIPGYLGISMISKKDIITTIPEGQSIFLVNKDTSIIKVN